MFDKIAHGMLARWTHCVMHILVAFTYKQISSSHSKQCLLERYEGLRFRRCLISHLLDTHNKQIHMCSFVMDEDSLYMDASKTWNRQNTRLVGSRCSPYTHPIFAMAHLVPQYSHRLIVFLLRDRVKTHVAHRVSMPPGNP